MTDVLLTLAIVIPSAFVVIVISVLCFLDGNKHLTKGARSRVVRRAEEQLAVKRLQAEAARLDWKTDWIVQQRLEGNDPGVKSADELTADELRKKIAYHKSRYS